MYMFGIETIYIIVSILSHKTDWISFSVAIGFLSWIIYNCIDKYVLKKIKSDHRPIRDPCDQDHISIRK